MNVVANCSTVPTDSTEEIKLKWRTWVRENMQNPTSMQVGNILFIQLNSYFALMYVSKQIFIFYCSHCLVCGTNLFKSLFMFC